METNNTTRRLIDRRLGEDRRSRIEGALEEHRASDRRKTIADRRAAAVLNARQQNFYERYQAARTA